eukprot:4831612-Amphidinium_carterae.1
MELIDAGSFEDETLSAIRNSSCRVEPNPRKAPQRVKHEGTMKRNPSGAHTAGNLKKNKEISKV